MSAIATRLLSPHNVHVDAAGASPKLTFAPIFNVSAALVDRHLTEGRADDVFARSESGDLTFKALADGVEKMSSELRDRGVGRGDRVLLLLPDCFDFYFAFLGAVRVGAIAVLANTYLRVDDYQHILTESEPKCIISGVECIGAAEMAIENAGTEATRYVSGGEQRDGWTPLACALGGPKTANSLPEPTQSTTDCFILYSSGSTGKPKGCVHQHKDLIYLSVLYAERVLGLTQSDVVFSIGKLFFAYGICNSLGFPLWCGCQVVLLERRTSAREVLNVLSTAKPTVYFSVPTALANQLAAVDNGAAADVSSLRICVSGGEPLSPNLFERWKRFSGLEIIEAVGSSEALHIYISNLPAAPRVGSVGKVVPGFDIEVRDNEGSVVPDGELGEIVIRGESLLKYFWRNPTKTAEVIRNGWYHTGDKGFRDPEGYFYFCGRNDDMLRVGSMWVAPAEVEAALMEHPAVLEAAVIGVQDENQLIQPKAFVILRNPRDASLGLESEILATASTRLARYKCPGSVTFVDDLPKTETGKIQRFRLRQLEGRS